MGKDENVILHKRNHVDLLQIANTPCIRQLHVCRGENLLKNVRKSTYFSQNQIEKARGECYNNINMQQDAWKIPIYAGEMRKSI